MISPASLKFPLIVGLRFNKSSRATYVHPCAMVMEVNPTNFDYLFLLFLLVCQRRRVVTG